MPNNLILIIAISNVQCIFNVHKKTIDFEHQEFSKLSMLEMWFKFREHHLKTKFWQPYTPIPIFTLGNYFFASEKSRRGQCAQCPACANFYCISLNNGWGG